VSWGHAMQCDYPEGCSCGADELNAREAVDRKASAIADARAGKLERIRVAAQDALDTGSATGSAVTLAARILSILEGTP
jgi:hypothetical protein